MRSFLAAVALSLLPLMPSVAQGAIRIRTSAVEVRSAEGNAGTHTASVVLTASPPPAQAPITGDYRTTDGTATAADNDYVPIVGGHFTIPPGESTATINVLIVGDLRVEADETFKLAFNNIQGANPSAQDVVITIVNDDGSDDGAENPVAAPVAAVVAQICARNETTFSAVCRELDQLTDAELTQALEHIAPQQSGAQSKVAGELVSSVTTGIGARLAALRSGTERFSVQQLSLGWNGRNIPLGALASLLFPQSGGGGEEPDYNGWSAFLSGNLGTGERVGRLGSLGFDLQSRGLMAGVDRQFGNNVFGVSVNLIRLESTLDESVGSLDVSGYALSLYGSRDGLFSRDAAGTGTGTRYDGVHLDGSLTLGRNTYDAEHIVAIGSLAASRATSSNDADIFAVTGGTGVSGHRGSADFDLSLSGTWSRTQIDDLTEEGNGPLILFVQGHDIESLAATLGLNVRSVHATSFGNLLPSFRAEMVHEFKDGARLVTARFLRDSFGTPFTVPLDQPDANYGRLAAGLQAGFPHGYSAYVEISQDVMRSDLHFRNVQFNVSKSF
jgi:uncharacterized protein YhjY with autotransporter beta-barrel domain